MPKARITMRKIKDILRLHEQEGFTLREIARIQRCSPATVASYVRRAKDAGLGWPQVKDMPSEAVQARLYPAPRSHAQPMPDWEQIHAVLARKGHTRELVWQQYRAQHPDGYGYSQFCRLYQQWLRRQKVTMRQEHPAGQQLFVDFAGYKLPYYDARTRKQKEAHLFVATMGYSKYTYVEATPDQKSASWLGAHVRALTFFGAVPQAIVCDNLKAAVSCARKYDADLNPAYSELSAYYNTPVVPARSRKPQDKAVVENQIKFCYRCVVAPLHGRTFVGLGDLNRHISKLVDEMNDRPFQKREGTRRSEFMAHDQPAMRPLPAVPFTVRQWRKAKVHMDYHVSVEKVWYSVPHKYVGCTVHVCLTDTMVQIFVDDQSIACHPRGHTPYVHHTLDGHMPPEHRRFKDTRYWLEKAQAVGPHTERLIQTILDRKVVHQHAYRTIMGILRLQSQYTPDRLEAACERAWKSEQFAYPAVAAILKHGADRLLRPADMDMPVTHDNIRGAAYYQEEPTDTPHHNEP